jgi:putative protein kinase ArgK-like GTPase of G3E family
MNAIDESALARHCSQIRAGDRRALARAITLIESTRTDHRRQAEALIEALLPDSGKSLRIGISGPPGVGKSTFIEAFGQYAIGEGKRLAVLAVDPTSRLSGGSILGDKTRMEALSRAEAAFIRPSPGWSARRRGSTSSWWRRSASASPRRQWRRWSISSCSCCCRAAVTISRGSSAASWSWPTSSS